MPSVVPSTSGQLPLVSCLMPAFNYGAYIGGAIESALAQDYPADRIEIVVVDDGSTDGTPEIVKRYGDRVRYLRKENGGINSAINRAMAECRGELIAFLDADDEWLPTKVSRQVDFMLRHPDAGLVYGDLEVIDADGALAHPSFWSACGMQPVRGRVLADLLVRNQVTGGSMMVRAEHLDRFHPMPPEAAWVDWWIALRVAEVAEIDYVAEPNYRYRLHGSNTNFGATGERLVRALERELTFRRWLMPTLPLETLSAEEVARAVAGLDACVAQLAKAAGRPVATLIEVSDGDRALAGAAVAAAARGASDAERVASLALALAHDPLHGPARVPLVNAGVLTATEAAHMAAPPARSQLTVVNASEAIADPALLAGYGRRFGPDDDATLLIALADDKELEPLRHAVAAAGLDGDDAPDMLASTLGPAGAGTANQLAPAHA